MIIRAIEPEDNVALAKIIRAAFDEFGIAKEGTVYSDASTDNLYELFRTPNSVYWVAEEEGVLLGACGLYPTLALPEGCVELVKFYIAANARNRGVGQLLLDKTLQSAADLAYSQIYLESFPGFEQAIAMYEKRGFKRICSPLGQSGHCACSVWMLKDL